MLHQLGAPLPFVKPAPGAPARPGPQATPTPEPPVDQISAATAAAMRLALPFVTSPDKARTATPPAAAPATPLAPAGPTRLTLEQYASVCAEIAVAPREARQIRAKYGMPDDATWSATDGAWQQRLSRDPALKARWIELASQFRDWLSKVK